MPQTESRKDATTKGRQKFQGHVGVLAAVGVIVFAASARPASGQPQPQVRALSAAVQQPVQPGASGEQAKAAEGADEEEMVHPFFTHEGLPDAVGAYSLRMVGVETRADGQSTGDVGFHFETGLTKFVGLHVRNDRVRANTRTEVMFQFAAVKSKNGQSGFAPIIEFELPTQTGDGSRINTLVGFTTKVANARGAFNAVVHYNPAEDSTDSSAALVVKAGSRYYPIVELLTEKMRNESAIVNLLLGLKVRVSKSVLLGFAVEVPTTTRRDFSSQLVFSPDMEWTRAR